MPRLIVESLGGLDSSKEVFRESDFQLSGFLKSSVPSVSGSLDELN